MKLFKFTDYKLIEQTKELGRISTPFGTLLFNLYTDNLKTSSTDPQKAYSILNNGRVLTWANESFSAELLICSIKPKLPKGMFVDDCYAGIWRLKALEDMVSCAFACEWEGNKRWVNHGQDGGQYLVAYNWDDGKLNITIGTEDEEFLASRASMGDMLPRRLEKEVIFDSIQSDIDGLKVPFTNVLRGELYQIKFLVSWGENKTAAWFAVDTPTDSILE